MPLIETVTAPEMKTPQEVAEVNQIIRRVCRSTGHVRTGVGAAREDVNVSVTGGTRIEIKGVPSIKAIPLLTYNEAMRQWNLLRLREELKSRGITTETFESKIDDITRLLKKTFFEPILNAVANGKVVKCITLKGFKGLLAWQTQTDTYFSKEISDRVRVIACISQLPNIIHSDSTENTLTSPEGQKIRKFVGAADNDALVIVWGDEEDAIMAANEVVIRAREATIGIPSETRQAFKDGTNGFERILPGPDRMYPDTDLPPIKITDERLDDLRAKLPEKYWINEDWYRELGLRQDIIHVLAISQYAKLFKFVVDDLKISPILASEVLVQFPKKLKKKGYKVNRLNPDNMRELFLALSEGRMVKDGFYTAMINICNHDSQMDESDIPEPTNDEEIEVVFNYCLDWLNDMDFYNEDKKQELLVGMMMSELRGRCNGSDIQKFVSTNYSEVK
jgi:glutamyl-tRNA(Gln) amidotransferase subunit E